MIVAGVYFVEKSNLLIELTCKNYLEYLVALTTSKKKFYHLQLFIYNAQ